ncbi:unnamed protein product [Rhizophagus irregularis]|nr:unnamed protein product [Rhizophagus irregularis]
MPRVNPLRNPKFLVLCGVFSIFLFLFIVVPEFQNHFPIPISVDVEPIQLSPELLLEPIYGYNNYSEFIQGHLPIVISMPHGGHLFPDYIPDRKQTFPSVVKSNDINTQEIGRELAELITEKFKGRKPYIIINHLGRSKLDVNRPLKEGAESDGSNFPSDTQIAWSDYHTFLNNAVEEIEERFGRGLLIDIHGHGHPENYIELGYVLSSEVLTLPNDIINSDPKISDGSSIRSLYNRKQTTLSFAELLRGKTASLGGRLQSYGYETIPSHVHEYPLVNEKYFHGGYSVQKYGSRHGEQVIDAIQAELPRLLRLGNKEIRDQFVKDFAESLSWFVKEYYWEGGQGSKRLTMDMPERN